MRLAVFSDIHGNLEALDAFLEHVANQEVHGYVCLGDVVGYGASPVQCLERIENLSHLRLILGNHEAAAIWRSSPHRMNHEAARAIRWTMDQLAESQTQRIAALEASICEAEMVFCHANPYHPTGWHYITTWLGAMRSFLATNGRITFVGHTHRPAVITRSNGFGIQFSDPPRSGTLDLDDTHRYIVNCGSIGQPRDGNPDASYLIFDTDRQCLEFFRLGYDIEGAARRIQNAGLPENLARRLFVGR